MSAVFLDTVGLLAVWDESDQWHSSAAAAMQQVEASRSDVLTTTSVLAECGNAAARRPYRLAVAELRDALEGGGMVVVPIEDDWAGAWESYRRGEAGNAGIVDHQSFAVMRRIGVGRAFTNDRHFAAAGFEILF